MAFSDSDNDTFEVVISRLRQTKSIIVSLFIMLGKTKYIKNELLFFFTVVLLSLTRFFVFALIYFFQMKYIVPEDSDELFYSTPSSGDDYIPDTTSKSDTDNEVSSFCCAI